METVDTLSYFRRGVCLLTTDKGNVLPSVSRMARLPRYTKKSNLLSRDMESASVIWTREKIFPLYSQWSVSSLEKENILSISLVSQEGGAPLLNIEGPPPIVYLWGKEYPYDRERPR